MDPYSILGVSRDADKEEIKRAYRRLVKENHPDRFLDEEEKKKATERLAKINEAYNMIEKGESFSSSYSGSDDAEIFSRVRRALSVNDILTAQSLLNATRNHNAEWNYLQGMVYFRQGFYDMARQHFKTAFDMEPMNKEYESAYNNVKQSAGGFFGSNPYINVKELRLDNCCYQGSCCAGLSTLCCTSCCCDCLGSVFRTLRC